MTKIAIMNQKGGVAKTTTALNLSAAIYRNSGNPILIDLDPQGHLSSIYPDPSLLLESSIFDFYQNNRALNHLCVDWKNVGRLIPSNRELIKVETSYGKGPAILNRLKLGLDDLKKHFADASIIIDCSPNLGVLTLGAIFAADLVIIPISSDFLSLKGAKKIEQTLNALESILKRRVERKYLLTRYDKRRHMSAEVFSMAKSHFGKDVLEVLIYENVDLAMSTHKHMDVFCYNNKCSGAINYTELYHLLVKSDLL